MHRTDGTALPAPTRRSITDPLRDRVDPAGHDPADWRPHRDLGHVVLPRRTRCGERRYPSHDPAGSSAAGV